MGTVNSSAETRRRAEELVGGRVSMKDGSALPADTIWGLQLKEIKAFPAPDETASVKDHLFLSAVL